MHESNRQHHQGRRGGGGEERWRGERVTVIAHLAACSVLACRQPWWRVSARCSSSERDFSWSSASAAIASSLGGGRGRGGGGGGRRGGGGGGRVSDMYNSD